MICCCRDRTSSRSVVCLAGKWIDWRETTERGQDTSRKVRAVGWGGKASVSNEPQNFIRAWRNLAFWPARWICAVIDKLGLA